MFYQALKGLNLGLEERLTTKVGLLSGGQRQALTLLMATLKKPKVLLLDEHTAALDPKTAEKVLAMSDKVVGENQLYPSSIGISPLSTAHPRTFQRACGSDLHGVLPPLHPVHG